jgi:hypothetical protein
MCTPDQRAASARLTLDGCCFGLWKPVNACAVACGIQHCDILQRHDQVRPSWSLATSRLRSLTGRLATSGTENNLQDGELCWLDVWHGLIVGLTLTLLLFCGEDRGTMPGI